MTFYSLQLQLSMSHCTMYMAIKRVNIRPVLMLWPHCLHVSSLLLLANNMHIFFRFVDYVLAVFKLVLMIFCHHNILLFDVEIHSFSSIACYYIERSNFEMAFQLLFIQLFYCWACTYLFLFWKIFFLFALHFHSIVL